MKTFSITTLGCRVNHYESEQLATLLRARGLVQASPADPADLRVVHTCSVTTQAASKSRQAARRSTRLPVLATAPASGSCATDAGGSDPVAAVRAIAGQSLSDESSSRQTHPKRTASRPKVVVTGCWATSDPKEAAALPGVDAVLGHHRDVGLELTRLLTQWETEERAAGSPTSLVREHSDSALPEPGFDEVWMMQKAGTPAGPITIVNEPHDGLEVNGKLESDEDPCEANHEDRSKQRCGARDGVIGTRSLPQLDARQAGHQRAFLKVQDGCDAHCTYCIIPQLRPSLWSKPIDVAVEEARRLVEAGHAELVLTGIFLGAYGQPTALRRRQSVDAGRPLAELVEALCERVPGLRRLRLSSLEPGDLTPELIRRLRRHPQVVPHFHLPLQSGADAILHRMNRQYTRADFLRMVEQLTEAFDRPAITTDIIVGFPGETDADFEQTVEVVERVRFIHTHAFPYSPRPRTAAARWTKQHVAGAVADARMARLRERATLHSLEFRRGFVGKVVEVLVERASPDERELEPLAGFQHGRCERYFAVHFEAGHLAPGAAARVRVDRVTPTRTFGTLVEGGR